MLTNWDVFFPLRNDRYLLEHGLKQDGKPDPDAKDMADGGSYDTFFTETGSGKYVPRSIFVDLDPSVRAHWPKNTASNITRYYHVIELARFTTNAILL